MKKFSLLSTRAGTLFMLPGACLVGVFVMGIAIYHISREFDHIDTERLSALKD